MSEEMEKIKEVIFTKVSLGEGEALFVTIKSDDVQSEELRSLGTSLRNMFPNNKIVMLNIGTGDELVLTSLKEESYTEKECCGHCHSEGE